MNFEAAEASEAAKKEVKVKAEQAKTASEASEAAEAKKAQVFGLVPKAEEEVVDGVVSTSKDATTVIDYKPPGKLPEGTSLKEILKQAEADVKASLPCESSSRILNIERQCAPLLDSNSTFLYLTLTPHFLAGD